jgi:UDP-2,4-diacetamido-2,4,6-trideoxy-beta-L-altropyranose hydrolase
MADAALLWRWANDAETRRRSFHSAPIPYAEHLAWLEARVAAEATRLWIFSDERGPVGQVRLDLGAGEAEVSLAVAPERRGQGLGTEMLRQALCSIRAEWPGGLRLLARVFADNLPSLRMFRRCGFREIDTRRTAGADVVVFEHAASAS